jgi:hypothetical protein
MRGGGAAIVLAMVVLPATAEENAMQEVTIEGVTIHLKAPALLLDRAARPESPHYDPKAVGVSVVFRNDSGHPIAVPIEEIGNGLVRVYISEASAEPLVDNQIPPPPTDGDVAKLSPGDSVVVPLSFSYPQPLIPEPLLDRVAVTFCVRWRAEWLRLGNYSPGAIGWNANFELCTQVWITSHGGDVS